MIITIGRSQKNDFVLENTTVSRQHAVLEIVDGHIVIRDVGSKSGTFVKVEGKLERTTYSEVDENQTIVLGNEAIIVRDVIDQAAKKNRAAVYELDPVTGEVVKK